MQLSLSDDDPLTTTCESKEKVGWVVLHSHENKHEEDDGVPEDKPFLSFTFEDTDMRVRRRTRNSATRASRG